MDDYILPANEIAELKRLHKTIKVKREADKVKAVYNLGAGYQVKTVADMLDISEQTVRQYFLDYRNDKTRNKKRWVKLNYSGKEPSLTPEQEQELSQHLEEILYQRSADVIQFIKKRYNVKYSLSGVKKLLHRIGFSYKKPKAIPGKLNPHLQKLFIRKYRSIRRAMDETDVLCFMDAMHPTHKLCASYGWIKKGKEKELPTNSGRQRLNINGVINIDAMRMTIDMADSINWQSTVRLFEKLLRLYPAGKIHIICDNAGYYCKREVLEWLAKHKRIKLHYLPPYSPNLNLIERVWKFFNEKVRNNLYYASFGEFKAACISFFRKRTKWASEFRTRLAENFQRFRNTQFQKD